MRHSKESEGGAVRFADGESPAPSRCKAASLLLHKQELSSSNTEGTHKKQPLDTTRLNSLKVLVFTKFPIDSLEEKEKCWKFIKGKINNRCRASKFVLGREG